MAGALGYPRKIQVQRVDPVFSAPSVDRLTTRMMSGLTSEKAERICEQIAEPSSESCRLPGISTHVQRCAAARRRAAPCIPRNNVGAAVFGRQRNRVVNAVRQEVAHEKRTHPFARILDRFSLWLHCMKPTTPRERSARALVPPGFVEARSPNFPHAQISPSPRNPSRFSDRCPI